MSLVPTARDAGLGRCPTCSLLVRLPTGEEIGACPRCDTQVHPRKPNSVSRTWAFLIAAFVLYIPANVFPIMQTETYSGLQNDTILSGIVYLWRDGSWALAVIVFTASIAVPLLKLLTMTFLLRSVQVQSVAHTALRARLYRIIELIGRWSMLDIYVVALLVSLVNVNALAQIHAGPGVIAFGSVVVLTLLAAESFDPRSIWDPLHTTEDEIESPT